MTEVDNIIIGAGPAGYELAAEFSKRGESVIIVERESLGGTCLNRGCIPTKTLCASANAVIDARFAPALGIDTGEIKIDYNRISSRVHEVVAGLQEGVAALLANCTLIKGNAVFVSSNIIKVNNEDYSARRIVIATGSQPASLKIQGADLALTSDEALWMQQLPESMVIIGGGVIGMEFASIFSALGVKVTVVEFCKEILPTIDSEIAKRLRMTLSRRGVDIIVGASVQKIESNGSSLKVNYLCKKGEASVEAHKVIMAIGRRPVIPVGFEGKLTSKGYVEVDEMMRTSVPGVYAVGDVNGLLMLAHAAYAQGRVILHDDPKMFCADNVPSVVFTNPEVACVGPSTESLDSRDIKYHVVKRPFASNGKAQADGHPDGVLKMIVSDDDDTVLSVTILGHHAADLISEATFIVTERIKYHEIASTFVHAHPTLSEIFI